MASRGPFSLRPSRSGRALALAALAALAAFAEVGCAAGATTTDDGGGGGGFDSSVDGSFPDGTSHAEGGSPTEAGDDSSTTSPIGGSCTDKTCAPPGTCTSIGGGKYCTEPCANPCPVGTYCALTGSGALCVPDALGDECGTCTGDSDCTLPSDTCVTSNLGDKFCARDCTTEGICPSGYACEGRADFGGGGTGGDSGASDAAATDAGGSTDAGGAEAATDEAGAGGPQASKWCVPSTGTCACTPASNGVMRPCSITNMYGTCTAEATCDGATGMWVGCPAAPSAEICNGKDDNCNGQIDEGDPNTLCAFEGAPPPNASWACTDAKCVVGACKTGWADFPPGGPISAGCACPVNASEPNALCAQATNAGAVTSVGGTPLVITGTLSSANDVNVYSFTSTDVDEMTTNSYHVAINFTEPAMNDEFVIDVVRGSPCDDTPTGDTTDVTSYDWCVNADGPDAGEAPCGPAAVRHCADHSSPYFLRVHRKAGATATCDPYSITITGGGGTCDLTQQCL